MSGESGDGCTTPVDQLSSPKSGSASAGASPRRLRPMSSDPASITPGMGLTGISSTLETLETTATFESLDRRTLLDLSPLKSGGSSDGGDGKKKAKDKKADLRNLPIAYITEPCPHRQRPSGTRVTLLLVVMRKKLMSKPMYEIVCRLVQSRELDICMLDEVLLLNGDQKDWPPCDALIAFSSSGYPLEKVEAYAARTKPVVVNDLAMQHKLMDRREVFNLLEQNDIPVPQHVVITEPGCAREGEYSWDQIEERDDAIAVKNGPVLMHKPFVEKPLDSDDHNIRIYFREDDGGGCQALFRKTDNRASEYHEGIQPIQRGGTRIYETFIATGGTDIKVYTVTGLYAHAEGRKAPVVDGKVLRDASGKELRCPIVLNATEKNIARRIVNVFKQEVCGFDLLRDDEKSYVCDVNGWSFVKQSRSYFEDCAELLYRLIMSRCARPPSRVSSPNIFTSSPRQKKPQSVKAVNTATDMGELVCVIAIVRHGERTPKQKSKYKSSRQEWVDLYSMNSTDPDMKKEIKLKHPRMMMCALEAVKRVLASDDVSAKERARCEIILDVLERFPFQGINRKIQIKPVAWSSDDGASSEQRVTAVQVILKWGGWLTESGLRQSLDAGVKFRKQMYVDDERGGLLRLHNTYRHDLKVHSSDEGRVQTTAAAFAKGLLGLDGSIPPILASLVSKGPSINALLDDCSSAKSELHEVKEKLHTLITTDAPTAKLPDLNPESSESIARALEAIDNPQQSLCKLAESIQRLLQDISALDQAREMYDSETVSGMHDRWSKVYGELISKTDPVVFNVSKLPDIYDCSRYDSQHNSISEIQDTLKEVFELSKWFANIVIPQEYGMTKTEKVSIARKISAKLRPKLIRNLRVAARLPLDDAAAQDSGASLDPSAQTNRFNPKASGFLDTQVRSPERFVRTRIYVTSESHCYAMMELLRNGGYDELVRTCPAANAKEGHQTWDEGMQMLSRGGSLGELTQIVCRLYEQQTDPAMPDVKQHTVEWLISTGQHVSHEDPQSPATFAPLVRLHRGMPLASVMEFLEVGLKE